ncbi:hypothetical protein [Cognatiyoonia sp. IB215182]|uniref:hypothetical protein n=1 Tax=Cognatiyoonia sp. IB215182 TaxID=3097353 RepID=UPI002A1414C9|nr:hypothetical protein [Cognatiyoonia sp. IB215182]MDX8355199.1 hypothetical protein [Cognatiyoonia sp. IB215182]
MTHTHATDFEEQLNCAFVLSSSLYFRLIAMDGAKRSRRLLGWDGLLHDMTRDLAGLSDANGTIDARIGQILSGISDLRHSLGDLAEIAVKDGQPVLGEVLQRRVHQLDTQIANDVR